MSLVQRPVDCQFLCFPALWCLRMTVLCGCLDGVMRNDTHIQVCGQGKEILGTRIKVCGQGKEILTAFARSWLKMP